MEGEAFVAKAAGAWIRQARSALDALERAGAPPDTPLLKLADIDYQQFCLLVEAMHALGGEVGQDVLDRAQMRPVRESF